MTEAPAREWPVDDPAALVALGEFFHGTRVGLATMGWACGVVAGLGPATLRLTRSQVAIRRRVGFTWLWVPRWLSAPTADVVLSIGLRRQLASPRLKETVEPFPGRWMHHLEVVTLDQLDHEVAGWLAAAYADAA